MRARTVFVCRDCGATSPRWLGRCHECGAWNTLEEQPAPTRSGSSRPRPSRGQASAPTRLSEVTTEAQTRISTGIGEFDRVLGGGLVPGSAVLLGGEPGIGKSTLLLQVMGALAEHVGPTLYVSGEESLGQLKQRADRLGVASSDLYLLCETEVEAILSHAEALRPCALVVDSIQTTATEALESAPGNIGQIRESAARLIRYAKTSDAAVFLVGHVTKEGTIAGPKVLEHIVDTVVYFEGDAEHSHRLVRATKNRFGATNELSVFEMSDRGLTPVENPSALFLSERHEGTPGSVVVCTMEGSRPLLLEIQALVSPTRYGTPMRVATGIDRNRVALLIAVLEKRGGVALENADVFVNVTGGVQLGEPGVDLGLVVAIASSRYDTPVDPRTVFIGEVGLGGEVRAVGGIAPRLAEAAKLGFERAILPARQAEHGNTDPLTRDVLRCVGVENVREALAAVL